MVYVLDCESNPFTIKLLYKSTNHMQKVTIGFDAVSKVIGLSATTKKQEIFASEVILRNDIVKLIAKND